MIYERKLVWQTLVPSTNTIVVIGMDVLSEFGGQIDRTNERKFIEKQHTNN